MSDGDNQSAATDAASASAAAVPVDEEVSKKPGKEAQSAADDSGDEDAEPPKEAEVSPEKTLAELKEAAKNAQAAYEKASGEKEKADAKKLRCQADSTPPARLQGTTRHARRKAASV